MAVGDTMGNIEHPHEVTVAFNSNGRPALVSGEQRPDLVRHGGSHENYVRADAYRGAVEALRVATTTVEEWEACHKAKHPDPEGFKRAAIEQGKRYLVSLGGR